MKKLVIYIEPEWAFGSIHYELIKRLYVYGINAVVLPWNRGYTYDEIQEIDKVTDYYMTTPHGWLHLKHLYNLRDNNRFIIFCHSMGDYAEIMTCQTKYEFVPKDFDYNKEIDGFHKFACVSNYLKNKAPEKGINRLPDVAPLGINYDFFYAEPSTELKTIGFAGSTNSYDRGYFGYENVDVKRFFLVQEVAKRLGLDLKIAQHYHNSFATMSGFYRSVDCVIQASIEEGGGLPVLEAGGAGRLALSTPVGHWNDRVKDYGGITLPIDEKEFIETAYEKLSYFIQNPNKYREKCFNIREHAKTYDWNNVIEDWVKLFY